MGPIPFTVRRDGSGERRFPRGRVHVPSDRPPEELRLAHVRLKGVHHRTMGNRVHEIHKRLLVLPDRERPELLPPEPGKQGVAEEPWGTAQLPLDLAGETQEAGHRPVGAQGERGEQGRSTGQTIFQGRAGIGALHSSRRCHDHPATGAMQSGASLTGLFARPLTG
jgi:hypothetical protein